MKRTFLALSLLIGAYHMSTTAVEKNLEPKVIEKVSMSKTSKTDLLRHDLGRVLAKTDRLENFKMAKVDLY